VTISRNQTKPEHYHLIALNPKSKVPKLLKADALEVLADHLVTATGRNYYLTAARQLRAGPGK